MAHSQWVASANPPLFKWLRNNNSSSLSLIGLCLKQTGQLFIVFFSCNGLLIEQKRKSLPSIVALNLIKPQCSSHCSKPDAIITLDMFYSRNRLHHCRGPKSLNFPDGNFQRAKTFRTKCVNRFRDKKSVRKFFL